MIPLTWPSKITFDLVAKEFIIGAKYMLRLFCWLILASMIARNIFQCSPILPTVGGTDAAYQYQFTLCHALEQFIKRKCDLKDDFLMGVTVGPIAEELAYRGLGQILGFASNWASLFAFAWVCSRSPTLGLFLLLGTPLGSIITLVLALKEKSALIPMISGEYVPIALLFPAQLQLLKMAKDQQQDTSPEPTSVDSNKSRNNRICKMVSTRNDTGSSTRLQVTVDRSLNLSARWFGSLLFAAAHVPTRLDLIKLPSVLQYAFLQKYIGTLASSFLVESRLVVSRGTLWGAIGAHITFNTLASSNYFISLATTRIFNRRLRYCLRVIPYVATLFFIAQKLLDQVVLVLEWIENRLGETLSQ